WCLLSSSLRPGRMPGSTGSARALAGELERCEKRFRPHALRKRTQAPTERGRNEPDGPRGGRRGGGEASGTGRVVTATGEEGECPPPPADEVETSAMPSARSPP